LKIIKKQTIIKILIFAGALALWDILLKGYYYSWAATQEPLASNTFGTAMLGYLIIITTAWIAAWMLTRDKEAG